MADEPNASNPNNIEMNATAHGDSKVTMVGQLNATEVKFFVDDIQPIPMVSGDLNFSPWFWNM